MAENGEAETGASAQAGSRAREVARSVEERLEGMRGYADEAGRWLRSFARERPAAAIALAAGFGFVLGRFLSRR